MHKRSSQVNLHETLQCTFRIRICGHNLEIPIFISERGELSEAMIITFLYDTEKQTVYINTCYGLKQSIKYSESFEVIKKYQISIYKKDKNQESKRI